MDLEELQARGELAESCVVFEGIGDLEEVWIQLSVEKAASYPVEGENSISAIDREHAKIKAYETWSSPRRP